jgi:serine protease Do
MAFNVPQEGAVLIENVTKNSPAYFMGLKGGFANISIEEHDLTIGGDIVLAIDDKKFDNPDNVEEAVKYINSLKKGQTYTLKVLRAGKMIDVKWTVR